jgi:hypothetical protein
VWERLTRATIGVLSIAKKMGIEIVGGMGEPGTEPEITDSLISLNGRPGCETLYLERNTAPKPWIDDPESARFAFCKTRRCAYDVVVTAILCLAEHYSDGFFRVRSDGEAAEWAEGLELANKVASWVQLPPRVLDPEMDD